MLTNGCYNRLPFRGAYKTMKGKVVKFRNSLECQYSVLTVDEKCNGCVWNRRENGSATTQK